MSDMDPFVQPDEERLAELIRQLPPAPDPWVEAAEAIPVTERALAQILALAQSDAEFRTDLIRDLENALERVGQDPDPELTRRLRASLEGSS